MMPPNGVPTELWERLEAAARSRARSNEPAHDFFHVERVVGNARQKDRVDSA